MAKYLISAGHSDADPGACANGVREEDICQEMRNMVAERLRARGLTVVEDGEDMQNLPLTQAIKMVSDAILAIELHCNAVLNPSATGVEVVALERDKETAQAIAQAIAQATGQRLRGDKGFIPQGSTARGRAGFVNAGGLIVEMLFISNPTDLERFLGLKNEVADALATAICGHEIAA